jgi:predicted kinase
MRLEAPRPTADEVAILQHIEVPGRPVPQPALVLMVGLPAFGKSVFARRLAPLIDACILESDALRRVLTPRPSHSANESRRLFQAINGVTAHLLSQRRNVIIDATNLTEADRQPAYDLADQFEVPLIILSCFAPWHEVEKRLVRRAAGADPLDQSDADLSVLRRMASRFQAISRERWLIDTSNESETSEALDLIASMSMAGAVRSEGKSN